MRCPRIHVLLDDTTLTPDVRSALQRIGAEVEISSLEENAPLPPTNHVDARLVVTADGRSITNGKLDTLLAWCARGPCATLVLSKTPLDQELRPGDAKGGYPIGFASRLSPDDLAGRLSIMCDLRPSFNCLRRELDELKRRQEAQREHIRCLDDQLQLAGSLQRSLQPLPPVIDGVDIHTVYRPAEAVSGDAYDVVRLDESHIAIAMADATGHDLAAGLLSVFVKRSLRGQVPTRHAYRLLDPDEVLSQVNHDIVEAQLQECQFVTAVYAIYHEKTRLLRWARGGAPYPVLARHGQQPGPLVSDGPLLGILPDAHFEVVELQLDPGDTLVFHTDGLNALLLNQHGTLGCCDIDRTEWLQTLGQEPIANHLERLNSNLTAMDEAGLERDDVTVLTLHVHNLPSIQYKSDTFKAESAAMAVPV